MVAATTRTSAVRVRVSPTRSNCCSCRKRSSLACRLGGQLADLVEEQRAALGRLDPPGWSRTAPVNAPLRVAEQLARQQLLGQRRAVDGHERPVAPRALQVHGAREHALAGAALAAEQDRGVGLRGARAATSSTARIAGALRVADRRRAPRSASRLSRSRHAHGQRALRLGACSSRCRICAGRERLGQVVPGAAADRLDGGLDGGVGGDDDDDDVRVARPAAAGSDRGRSRRRGADRGTRGRTPSGRSASSAALRRRPPRPPSASMRLEADAQRVRGCSSRRRRPGTGRGARATRALQSSALRHRRGSRGGRRAAPGRHRRAPNWRSSARFSASTLTRGSPRKPELPPFADVVDEPPHALDGDAAGPARRAAPARRRRPGERCGSRPLAEAVTSSAGMGSGASGFSLRRRATSAVDAVAQLLRGRAEVGAADAVAS